MDSKQLLKPDNQSNVVQLSRYYVRAHEVFPLFYKCTTTQSVKNVYERDRIGLAALLLIATKSSAQ